MEVERMLLVLKCEGIAALGGTELMIIDAVVLVGIGEFFSCHGTVVGAVEEAILAPGGVGEFGPFDMVVEQTAGLGVEHIYFGPVGTAARDGICHVAAVVAHRGAGKGYGAVVAQRVRIEEHFLFASDGFVGAIKYGLIFQSVVAEEIIAAVGAQEWGTLLHIVVEVGDALAESTAEGDFREIIFCKRTLLLYPGESFGRSIVFERAIRVGDFLTEIEVDSIACGSHRILFCAGAGSQRDRSDCHSRKCRDKFHFPDIEM